MTIREISLGRINTTAHQGFCGMCGPCSCNNSNRNSAINNGEQSDLNSPLSYLIAGVRRETTRLRVDTWWRKPTIPQKFRTNQPRAALRETQKKIVEEEVAD